jgi:hypothetical protein
MPIQIQNDQLTPQEAIDYFAQKTGLDTDTWVDGQGTQQLANFTVAAAKGALLQDIHDTLGRAIEAGESAQDFITRFAKVSDRWAGRSAWRAQLIYDQNIRQAYGLGRWQQMQETATDRPYLQWRHGNSSDPRPEHLAMDRKIFKIEDVTVPLPSGFGCTCQYFSLSPRDFERNGGKLSVFDLEPDEGFLYRDDIEQKIDQLKVDRTLKDAMRGSLYVDAKFAKIPEGKTKILNGKTYVLNNSRWHLQEDELRTGAADSIDDLIEELEKQEIESTKELWAKLNSPGSNSDEIIDQIDEIYARNKKRKETPRKKEIMEQLRQNLLDTGMAQEEAMKLVGKIDMNVDRSRNKIRESAVEFFQLTNGGGANHLREFVYSGRRPTATFELGRINVGDASKSSIFHEMAHFAELEYGSKESNDWLKSRATGELQTGREIYGWDHPDEEKFYPDHFVDKYVGKIYEDSFTEVLSVGFEHFDSPENMLHLWNADKEHFKLTIKYLKKQRS